MIKSKWIRRALLGGVAMAVMASGAQAADDLEALKAQIEALQARVNAIEAKGVNLPEGVSLITFQRGHKEIKMVAEDGGTLLDKAPESRGFTIAITPTADLPAPTTEITISGEIRTVGIWGKTKDTDLGKDSDFDLEARGTINIRSRTDTPIGQIRTRVEVRAQFGSLNPGERVFDDPDPGRTREMQARRAYGEWDFMPGWTLLAGHHTQIAAVTNVAYNTIFTPFGLDSTRNNQVRITYSGGPIVFGMGIEDPSQDDYGPVNSTTMPDFAGFMQFNAPMGISLRVTGEAGKVGKGSTAGTDTGYLIGAGAAASMGMLNLNVGYVYTKGLGCDAIFSAGGAGDCRNSDDRLMKGHGVQVNASANLTESVIANASFGYFKFTNARNNTAPLNQIDAKRGYSVHGNLVWRPVDAFQTGIEAGYYNVKWADSSRTKTFAAGFGFWFFF